MSKYLGWKLKDKVTGFTGIAVAYVSYLTGCSQYCLVPEMKEQGKYPDGTYIDHQRLVPVGKKPTVELPSSDTGADFMIDAPKC